MPRGSGLLALIWQASGRAGKYTSLKSIAVSYTGQKPNDDAHERDAREGKRYLHCLRTDPITIVLF